MLNRLLYQVVQYKMLETDEPPIKPLLLVSQADSSGSPCAFSTQGLDISMPSIFGTQNTVNQCRSSLESYQHKAAKQVLTEWLRDAAQAAGFDSYASFSGLDWKVNRMEPDWGIYQEYPVNSQIKSESNVLAWDETGLSTIPSFLELDSIDDRPSLIFDVAVQEKGRIVYAFEVVHKSPVSFWKSVDLNQLEVETYAIDAAWILSQVKPPEVLKATAGYGKPFLRTLRTAGPIEWKGA